MCFPLFFADIISYSNDAKTTHDLNLTHYKNNLSLAGRHVIKKGYGRVAIGFRVLYGVMADTRAVGYVGTHTQFGMGKIIVPLVRLPNDFWISKKKPLRGEIGTSWDWLLEVL